MIMFRTGRAQMEASTGGFARMDASVDFPGLVLSATAVLCGFRVNYGTLGTQWDDHHVRELGAPGGGVATGELTES